ncbi:MAG: hypothetical protein R3C45_12040 [Phycisphaerales bacterium]
MHTPQPLMTKQLPTAIGLAVLMATGLPTYAQTPAGNNGRALDANLQVGSNGINPEDGRLDFSHQNDIVTGNVGGGRAFQDNVGYGAVGEFRDNLGSDTLFNFRAQSLSSSPNYLNAASVGGVGQGGNVSIYRSFTNRSAQPQGPGLIAPNSGYYQVAPSNAFDTIYTSQINTQRSVQGLGGPNPSAGLALQAFGDRPTVGLNGQPLADREELSQQLYKDAKDAGTYQTPDNLGDSMRYDTNLFDPFGKSTQEDLQKQMLQPGQLPATMLIGQQLQLLNGQDPNAADKLDPTRSRQVLDTVFNRLEKKEAQGDGADVYDKLLRSIKDRENAGSKPDKWDTNLDAPTPQQLTEAERAYDAIMKDLYGDDYKSRRKETATKDPDTGDADSGDEVRGVVDQLNYDLPRLETLASNKQTRVANLTREAEAALAAGKYLTAESRYRQLILDVKDDPMPRVGLVHAQLGAGMFRSAGMNLRALFVQHPELIAARYDQKLLPPQDRLQWVQRELQTVISQGEGGKDAPLLMAYLGYQANSRQLVRYGLALAQSESPRDPLLAVIREIWLDGDDDSSSDGK